MKISDFRKCKDNIADLEMTNEEREKMLDYGRKNCSIGEVDDFLINWALVDLLKKGIKREQGEYFRNELLKDETKR